MGLREGTSLFSPESFWKWSFPILLHFLCPLSLRDSKLSTFPENEGLQGWEAWRREYKSLKYISDLGEREGDVTARRRGQKENPEKFNYCPSAMRIQNVQEAVVKGSYLGQWFSILLACWDPLGALQICPKSHLLETLMHLVCATGSLPAKLGRWWEVLWGFRTAVLADTGASLRPGLLSWGAKPSISCVWGNIALWSLLVFMVDRGRGSHVNLKVCSFERACLTQATFLGCMKMICFMERSRWP